MVGHGHRIGPFVGGGGDGVGGGRPPSTTTVTMPARVAATPRRKRCLLWKRRTTAYEPNCRRISTSSKPNCRKISIFGVNPPKIAQPLYNMKAGELQQTVAEALGSMNSWNKMKKVWEAGKLIYGLSTWGTALAALSRHQDVEKVAATGVGASGKIIMEAL